MKKSFLLLFCLAAVSLSACKKSFPPVPSDETCSNAYLLSHPDLQKFFEANPDAYNSFQQGCQSVAQKDFESALLKQQINAQRRRQALQNLQAKANPLANVKTCQANYLQAHPDFLKNNLPIDQSVSDVINAD
ncbi:MAG: hypothetical protein IIT66_03265, partial [Acetobacter sp.]|nr:hypothetical protein [Acetobacter sp.]